MPTAFVVDDDLDLRLQLQLVLEGFGFSVRAAGGQAEAETWIRDPQSSRPDLAVLDLMMEHEDSGFVLAWQLKRRWPDLPVLIVTAVSARTGMDFDAVTREERSWVRADAVLTKPIRPDQLQKEIRRLLPHLHTA